MSKRLTPFLFFCHFIARHNIVINRDFDAFENAYMNRKIHPNVSIEPEFKPYFDIFRSHFDQSGMFWYIAVLYLCPVDIIRRFYIFLQVETWKVKNDQTENYDSVQEKSKTDMLQQLDTYVHQDKKHANLHFVMMIQAMTNFF